MNRQHGGVDGSNRRLTEANMVVATVDVEHVGQRPQGHQSDTEPAGGMNVVGFVRQPRSRHREDVGKRDRPAVMSDKEISVDNLELHIRGCGVVRVLDDFRKPL